MRALFPTLLVLVTIAVFSPVCANEFMRWDDYRTMNDAILQKGDLGHFWKLGPGDEAHLRTAPGSIFMPVAYTFWWALLPISRVSEPDVHGSTLNSWIYHSASLLLHVGNVLLVYFLLIKILRGSPRAGIGSFAGGLLFAIHPIQTEAIAWASGAKDLLYAGFALGAASLYLEFASTRRFRWLYYAAATLCCVLSMLSKPTGAFTPLFVFTLAVVGMMLSWKRTALTLLPWFIMAVPIMVIAKIIQPPPGGVEAIPLYARPLMAGDALAFYLYKLILPLRLAVDYGWRPDWIIHARWFYFLWIIPVGLAIVLWMQRRKRPVLLAASLLFIIPLTPVLGVVPFAFQFFSTVADHYVYLAAFGVALALGYAIGQIQRQQVLIAALTIFFSISVLWGIESVMQSLVWRDDTSLWSNNLAINPKSFVSMIHLGNVQSVQGNFAEAMNFYARSMEVYPENVESTLAMAIVLGKQNRFDEEDRYGQMYLKNLDRLPPFVRRAYWDNERILALDMQRNHRPDRAIFYLEHKLKSLETVAPFLREKDENEINTAIQELRRQSPTSLTTQPH